MRTTEIVALIDDEFSIATNEEALTDFAILDESQSYVYPPFLDGETGLFTCCSAEIEQVITGVFLTREFVESVPQDSLIVTHHHFDYFEDERGLVPLSAETLKTLSERNTSIYALHAPLDTHPVHGTSRILAEYCGISVSEMFFDYYGAPAALIGNVPAQSVAVFSDCVRNALQRPDVTVHKHRANVERVAVIAGGGDMPGILQHAHDAKCDTMFTGTIVNRWGFPRGANREFLDLNNDLRLNLIGGTHYGTERPAMIKLVGFFENRGIPCRFVEDSSLLSFRDTE